MAPHAVPIFGTALRPCEAQSLHGWALKMISTHPFDGIEQRLEIPTEWTAMSCLHALGYSDQVARRASLLKGTQIVQGDSDSETGAGLMVAAVSLISRSRGRG